MLSIVVVFHNMTREADRTLRTLSATYQRGVNQGEYEVIAVDAGSDERLDEHFVLARCPNARLVRTAWHPSPARAVNAGARAAKGEFIGVCVDGARMLSPGVVEGLLAGHRLRRDAVVGTLGFHLGPKLQSQSVREGYSREVEDALLDGAGWQADGYNLFRIAAFAGSSRHGWFMPLSESNCLAVSREAWASLGGFDERFASPAGGFVNLDFYRRACDRASELVLLLGEGTFHQVHGGVATNASVDPHPSLGFAAEYLSIRGVPFEPVRRQAIYIGRMPPQAHRFFELSLAMAAPADIRP